MSSVDEAVRAAIRAFGEEAMLEDMTEAETYRFAIEAAIKAYRTHMLAGADGSGTGQLSGIPG